LWDVDFPQVRSTGFLDAIKMMFSKRLRDQRIESLRIETLEKVKRWAADNPRRAVSAVPDGCGITPVVYRCAL